MELRKLLAGAGIMALAGGYFLIEQAYLRGNVEYRETFSVRNGDELYFELDKPGVEHTLEIYTSEETSLQFTLVNPDGVEVVTDTELASHKGSRLYNFTPYAEGEWLLSIDRRALSKSGRMAGTVSILTADKRPFSCQM